MSVSAPRVSKCCSVIAHLRPWLWLTNLRKYLRRFTARQYMSFEMHACACTGLPQPSCWAIGATIRT